MMSLKVGHQRLRLQMAMLPLLLVVTLLATSAGGHSWGEDLREKMHTDYTTQYAGKQNENN